MARRAGGDAGPAAQAAQPLCPLARAPGPASLSLTREPSSSSHHAPFPSNFKSSQFLFAPDFIVSVRMGIPSELVKAAKLPAVMVM